ncbi:glycoside hydrolase family 2 TIM barrel-domain containing protein [Salegentibacter sp. F188]|uniref:beta-galactosidase n=1 Tax=Autumnicola patrickiae TaxID=3075591 RepID=A0ABU3DYY0_9FLAO|nr:glycoside hydrolase family 2 TIM barrel-domain containing protein [Salegentibacter sp. F188]MDT0688931.1 glycoside hydrolase family 2 TIM barrel-domain containing protein [Salegentibacter sp. F188]
MTTLNIKFYSLLMILCGSISIGIAQQTEKIYLSGESFEEPVEWDFMVTDGMNSNKWSKINVPNQWELEGFGTYTYGRWYKELEQDEPSKEEGFYKYEFEIPQSYKGKAVKIVFGGAMTDTEVKVNGKLVGPKHQGGFYQFEYDISDFLDYGNKNLLEVHVWKHSENHNVNRAERYADWWLFGGIYRSVWLEIKPKSHIEHFAVDARMDGSLTAEVDLKNIPENAQIEASILPLREENGDFETFSFPISENSSKDTIHAKWENVKPWNPEDPNLYKLKLKLTQNGKTLHEATERIGFRTLEFRKKDGIYVNGTKILMKGVNRHTIWPESGRSTSKRISVMDVNLIKDMNMNAVRFHYPPDKHFLEVCDSLGLFVLNELAGWQNPYDTETGTKLVKEMVQRDVNHPSIIIWDQGNEGGWNYELDSVFHEYDPQKRIVIHPWADFDGWDTHHYPTYLTGMHRFNSGENVFFPTEFMHGTYDNGHGAGLDDFWDRYTESPLFAGGFLWVFNDAAVLRTDWEGEQKYDSKGNLAPDGILGPFREKEGSFYTIKEVWAPIQFEPRLISETFDGSFLVTNDFLFNNLNSARMEFRVKKASENTFYSNIEPETIASGEVSLPDSEPGETRKIKFDVPAGFFEADWLEITAWDKHEREIYTWTWPIHRAEYFAEKFLLKQEAPATASVEKKQDEIILSGGDIEVKISAETGEILQVENGQNKIPFLNGPHPVGMKAEAQKANIYREDGKAICEIEYAGGIHSIKWTMHPDGRLKMEMIALKNARGGDGFDGAFFEDNIDKFGITFDFPEEGVEGFKWLGKGPFRVWKNRLKGTEYNIWEKEYNTTITGESFENLIYPEFKGYHANVIGAHLKAGENSFRVFSENDKLFLRLFTPDEPKNAISNVSPYPEFPPGDISFMYEIPGMRAFKPLSHQGPSSQPTNIRIKSGDEGIKMNLWFDFRNFSE